MTYATWLSDLSAKRCILVEAAASISGIETIMFLSTAGYVTGAADAPANTIYMPGISGGVQITEEILLDGSPSLSYGDIELFNMAGERDAWLDYVWVNRTIKVFIGDVSWPRADFQLIFDGIIANLDSSRYDRLNIKIRDKFQRLNSPVTDTVLGGATTNANVIIPTLFGECCNVTPLLTDPATHEYQVHNGPIEGIIEVRDNGVPVTTFTPNLTTGKFTLGESPAGAVTVSVQGDKPSAYANTISLLVQRLATGFGKSATRFISSDLDTAGLAAFETAHPQPVGIYISTRTNVLEAIQQLANSVGANAIITRTGTLSLRQIVLPPTDTPTAITAADMVSGSLHIVSRIDVKSSVKVGYCKNWTVQDKLVTGIPESSKALFSAEFLTITQTDSTVATAYKLDADPVQRDTLLLKSTDATAEAARELAIYSTPRTIFSFEMFSWGFLLVLGQAVTLTHPRFGLNSGKTGIVTKLQPDWMSFRIVVEVLV